MEIGGCQEIDLEHEAGDLIGNFQFPEPERHQRNGRYNLRKSIPWDSAFFTSAGVLDQEELSSMITKLDKKQKHILPGIQEELTGSTDSISTLQSDCLTLESNDDDLFLNIRASIERSSEKVSNLSNSSSKIAAMVLDGRAISSPKKEDFVSQNKTLRMSKSQLKPIGKLPPGRSIKPDSAQSQAGSIGKTGEANLVVAKPLKIISSSVPSSTAANRESVGIGRVQPKCGSSKQGSVSGKVPQPPKVSALGGSRKMLPKPAVSSKCSSVDSSTTSTVLSTRSSTSNDKISTTSGNAANPILMTARRNLGKSSKNSNGPSGTIPKTPSIASASLVSEWFSVSTTSSVVNLRSNNSSSTLDTSSCMSVDDDNMRLDPRHKVGGQNAERQGNQGAISTSNTSNKSSATSGTLQAPMKPSGLRLPSPRFGFFDWSSSRTPEGNQSFHLALHPVIPNPGAAASTPTRSSNGKLKSSKVPTARSTSLANIKSGSPEGNQSFHLALHPVIPNPGAAASTPTRNSNGKLKSSKVPTARSTSLANIKSGSPEGNQSFHLALHPVIPNPGAAASTPTRNSNGKLKSSKVPTARSTSLANIKSGSPNPASPASSHEKSHSGSEYVIPFAVAGKCWYRCKNFFSLI